MSRIARRPLLGGLAALAAPAGRAAAQAGAPAAPANELRLGALFPFSGGLAVLGDESFRGLELAAEERNAAGGVLGRLIWAVRQGVLRRQGLVDTQRRTQPRVSVRSCPTLSAPSS